MYYNRLTKVLVITQLDVILVGSMVGHFVMYFIVKYLIDLKSENTSENDGQTDKIIDIPRGGDDDLNPSFAPGADSGSSDNLLDRSNYQNVNPSSSPFSEALPFVMTPVDNIDKAVVRTVNNQKRKLIAFVNRTKNAFIIFIQNSLSEAIEYILKVLKVRELIRIVLLAIFGCGALSSMVTNFIIGTIGGPVVTVKTKLSDKKLKTQMLIFGLVLFFFSLFQQAIFEFLIVLSKYFPEIMKTVIPYSLSTQLFEALRSPGDKFYPPLELPVKNGDKIQFPASFESVNELKEFPSFDSNVPLDSGFDPTVVNISDDFIDGKKLIDDIQNPKTAFESDWAEDPVFSNPKNKSLNKMK